MLDAPCVVISTPNLVRIVAVFREHFADTGCARRSCRTASCAGTRWPQWVRWPGDDPAMMEMDAVGAIENLCENRSLRRKPRRRGTHRVPRRALRRRRPPASRKAEDILVPNLRDHTFPRHIQRLKKRMKSHHPEPDRPFAHGGVARLLHARRRPIDEILQQSSRNRMISSMKVG